MIYSRLRKYSNQHGEYLKTVTGDVVMSWILATKKHLRLRLTERKCPDTVEKESVTTLWCVWILIVCSGAHPLQSRCVCPG